MIRVLVRYETGNYEIKDLPTNDNLGLMQLILDKQIEEIFDQNPNYIFKDLAGTKISVAKLDDDKPLNESRLVFFKNLKHLMKERFQDADQSYISLDQANIPGPLLNRDIEHIKSIFNQIEDVVPV